MIYVCKLFLPPGAKINEKQHLRIQEGHFLKIALNLDLTLPDDGACPTFLIRPGIIDLGAFCVELWSFYCSKRISVPMSGQSTNHFENIISVVRSVNFFENIILGVRSVNFFENNILGSEV